MGPVALGTAAGTNTAPVLRSGVKDDRTGCPTSTGDVTNAPAGRTSLALAGGGGVSGMGGVDVGGGMGGVWALGGVGVLSSISSGGGGGGSSALVSV